MRRLIEFTRRHPDAVAALALLLLPLALLGHALMPGKVMSPADLLVASFLWAGEAEAEAPQNGLLGDITYLFHPSLIYAANEIRAGRFPTWNPHEFAGVPFFANPQTGLLFPLHALAYILPLATALTLISILKLSVAGLGMYWFLRQLPVSVFPAFIASVTFMFSGVLITWLQWSHASAVIVLPLLFAVTERLRTSCDFRAVSLLAVAVAIEIFAGYPQVTIFGFITLLGWVLYRLRGASRPFQFLSRWALGMALGLALGAVQILPFLEYLRASSVYAYRAEWMPVMSLPLRALIALLIPHYFGSPTGRDFWGPANFNEITTTVGLVPWLMLPVTLIAAWSRPGAKFFLVLAALSGSILYEIPLLSPLLASLPPFSLIIGPRIAGFFTLSLCVLTAFGLDAMQASERPANLAQRCVKVGFLALLGIAFLFLLNDYSTIVRAAMKIPIYLQYAGFLALATLTALFVLRLLGDQRKNALWFTALCAVQLANVLPLLLTYNPVIEARRFYPQPSGVIKHIQQATAQDHGRFMYNIRYLMNLGTIFGLYEVGGYDGMTPRTVEQLADTDGTIAAVASNDLRVTADFSSEVFNLLGVRHVLTRPGAETPAPHFALEYDGPDGRVFGNNKALPRAFLVFRTRTCLDDKTSLNLMHSDGIDFREEVVIAGCENVPPAGPRGHVARAEIREYSAASVVIEATNDSPGYLVLTDTWFPGWTVLVNGSESTVWRANHAFRAVWLPPGRHTVAFSYRPKSLKHGLTVSLLATLAGVTLFFVPGSRRNG